MGYLSCKAESSVSISSPTNSSRKSQPSDKEKIPTKKIQHFNYTDLELATNNFSDKKLLGRGSHGLVYKAVLRNGRQVAVKKPSIKSHEMDNEIDILSNLQSPRLVNLLGFTENSVRDRLLVVEFMSNGTLYDALHSSSSPPNWGRRVKLALQTAKAIDTLHCLSPPVVHRDIKSANVLLDRDWNARLGDFGLALRLNRIDDRRVMSTPPAGTMGYLDPGYVTPDNLSTKTDVFSFGILLLEIMSGRKAIDVGHSPPSIVDWAIPLIRKGKILSVFDPKIEPPKDPLVRRQLAVIAAKCVRGSRERRPAMKEIVEWLTGLSKLVPLHSWNGLPNPCLMIENVGQPVVLSSKTKGFEEEHLGGKDGKPLRNARRVYSDLGFKNNLLDLMAGTNKGGSDSRSKRGSSVDLSNDKSEVFKLKRNQSVGEDSDIYARKGDRVSTLKPSVEAAA